MVSDASAGLPWHLIAARPGDARRSADWRFDRGEMKHETSIALHEYWRSCRGRTGVPANEIRAVELAPLLPSLFLVDLDFAAGFPFRFCGAAIATRYGRDLTDECFLSLWSADDAESLDRHARAMAPRCTGLVAGMVAETVGAAFTAFELLILPLTGETGSAGAIGSMARIGGHEEMNRIRARIVSQSLRSVRFLPAARQTFPRSAGAPAAISPLAPQTQRRYRHLTVVTGGR
jgi:hypothetical protein